MKVLVAAIAAVLLCVAPAQAKRHPTHTHSCYTFMHGVTGTKHSICRDGFMSRTVKRARKNGRTFRHTEPRGASPTRHNIDERYPLPGLFGGIVETTHRVGRTVARVGGLVPQLAAKVQEITSACGSHVISGVRHTLVAGTHRISLHASGRAADVQGNPSCIYAHLGSWPGGYSTDYATAPGGKHVHISYDDAGHREWGVRFVHHHGGRTRYAHRQHHRRMAMR